MVKFTPIVLSIHIFFTLKLPLMKIFLNILIELTEATVLVSPFFLQIDTFGRWRRFRQMSVIYNWKSADIWTNADYLRPPRPLWQIIEVILRNSLFYLWDPVSTFTCDCVWHNKLHNIFPRNLAFDWLVCCRVGWLSNCMAGVLNSSYALPDEWLKADQTKPATSVSTMQPRRKSGDPEKQEEKETKINVSTTT